MTAQEKLLIEICKAYLNNNSVSLPDNINLQELYRLAKHHNLLGVCYCALNASDNRENIPLDFMNALRNKFFDSVYIYECQQACLTEVRDILTASQIRHILFKGIVLRNLYPVAESRSMGDIDILIDRKNRDKVKALLIKAGFLCTEGNGPVYNYRKNGVLLEVHTRIISEFGDNAFADAFNNAAFNDMTGTLNDDYHTAYLIAHTAHHFKFYGAGIRHVLDLAVMQTKRNIDLERVMEILRPIGLDTFAGVLLSVCYEWFNAGRKFTENTAQTQDYLCRCGVFGSMQENVGSVVSRKEMETGGKMSSFKIKLRLAFPPYSKLKNINYIKFIDGRPWLTPYAWCYRFFYNLKNRKKFLKKTLNELDDKKTQELAEQELAYFKEIGLL